jgi:hypothetical protein
MKLHGTITTVAGATTNNSTTAVPFSVPHVYYIQCSTDCYIKVAATSALAVATSADFVAPQYAILEMRKEWGDYIAMLPVAGTAGATLKVGVK